MQNDQVRPANQQNQLIHKQREEDPVFLKFLQSSCPIELLNSASPVSFFLDHSFFNISLI